MSVAEAYRDRRSDIADTSASLLQELQRLSTTNASDQPLQEELLNAAYIGIVRNYDPVNGGFGGAPKFPPAMQRNKHARKTVLTIASAPLESIDAMT